MKKITWFIPFVCFIVLSFFLWRGLSHDPHALPSVNIGRTLPVFQVPSLDQQGKYLTSKMLQHHVSLLNVWASWCDACADEQSILLQIAATGLRVYGLNYKDHPQEARAWLQQWGNPYTAIGVDTQGQVAIDLGVYGTPETFLIDQNGVIRARYVGALTMDMWENVLQPQVHALEKQS